MANRDKDETKAELRRARLQEEAGARAAERRQRMVKLGAAAFFGAIAILIIAVVVSQSGDGGGKKANTAGLVDGIPQQGTVLGQPSAKVKVLEFGDLQCPICQQYSQTVVPEVIRGPVRRGEASIEFVNWTIIGPQSATAARAALAASEQDRYWQFVDTFYANQGTENSGYVTDSFLTGIAEKAGVPDIAKWNRDRALPRWKAVIAAGSKAAEHLGFSGTPSFAVQGPSGTVPLGTPRSAADIEKAIAQGG
jgi:protein-disulfide isomerase